MFAKLAPSKSEENLVAGLQVFMSSDEKMAQMLKKMNALTGVSDPFVDSSKPEENFADGFQVFMSSDEKIAQMLEKWNAIINAGVSGPFLENLADGFQVSMLSDKKVTQMLEKWNAITDAGIREPFIVMEHKRIMSFELDHNWITSIKMYRESINMNHIFMLSPEEKALLEKKANADDAQAAFRLYQYYSLGGVHEKIGMQWLRIAANKGHVMAQYNLGNQLTQSADPQEESEGLKWLQLTEKHGLGVDYNPLMPNRRTEKEEKESSDDPMKAKAGDAQAAYRLFKYYYWEKIDEKIGMHWLRVAANQGHVMAQYNLGSILIRSTDPQEKSEGLKWLQLTEKHGMGARLSDYNSLSSNWI